MDMQTGAPDVAAIHPVEFWTEYAPGADGVPVAADWVRWVKKGATNGATTAEKVVRAQRDPHVWPVVRPFYQAWKEGQDVPVNGTPLDAAPFMTREAVKALANLHVRSVEDLAAMEDAAVSRSGIPGLRDMRTKASAYLSAQANVAAVAEELAARDSTIEAMREQIEDMRRAMDEMAQSQGRRRRSREEAMAQPEAEAA